MYIDEASLAKFANGTGVVLLDAVIAALDEDFHDLLKRQHWTIVDHHHKVGWLHIAAIMFKVTDLNRSKLQ